MLEERGTFLAKIGDVAQQLPIVPPNAVETLKRTEAMGLVRYKPRTGVGLTKNGRKVARDIIRNHRLFELLLVRILKAEADKDTTCGLEHHVSEKNSECDMYPARPSSPIPPRKPDPKRLMLPHECRLIQVLSACSRVLNRDAKT